MVRRTRHHDGPAPRRHWQSQYTIGANTEAPLSVANDNHGDQLLDWWTVVLRRSHALLSELLVLAKDATYASCGRERGRISYDHLQRSPRKT